MKIEEVLDMIDGFAGLREASIKAYKKRITKVFNLSNDLSKYEETLEAVNTVENINTRKDLYGAVLAVAKRSSRFREYVGDEALDAYLVELKKGNDEAMRNMERATEDKLQSVPSIQTIMEALPGIEKALGQYSTMYLSAYLYTNIVGLRAGDLSRVRVVSRFNPKWNRQYVKSNGRLYISDFKTSKTYPPYDMRLDKDIRGVIDRVLKRFPERKWLLSEGNAGDLISKAFAKVGMKVSGTTIRHSQISALLAENPNSIPHAQSVARRFKHSEEVTRMYYRQTND